MRLRLLWIIVFLAIGNACAMRVLTPSKELINSDRNILKGLLSAAWGIAGLALEPSNRSDEIAFLSSKEVKELFRSMTTTLENSVDKNFSLVHYLSFTDNIYALVRLIEYNPHLLKKLSVNCMSPLHCACAQGNVECVKKLVELGASRGLYDDDGRSEFHHAVRSGRIELVFYLIKTDSNLNLNDTTKTDHFTTALHHAVQQENFDMVDLLLAHGASINVQRRDGKTPLDLVPKNNKELINFLKMNYGYYSKDLLRK